VPSGVSGPILLKMVPHEILSNIVVRPFTLANRLFATMFAGHLLVALFYINGAWLILHYAPTWQGVAAGVFAFLLGIFVSFLDMLIMFLQAYVFTLLSAMYIAGAVADEH
jgi:F-type H+-transporting ATPase subunit a